MTDTTIRQRSRVSARTRWSNVVTRLDPRQIGLPIATVVLLVTFASTSSSFLSHPNFVNLSLAAAALGCASLGQTFPLLTGGLDLSVGSTIGLVSVVAGLGSIHFGTTVGLLMGLGTGVITGSINGFIVTVVMVPPFIATLATLSAFSGFALYASGGIPVTGIPTSFSNLAYQQEAGIPIPLFVLIAVFIAVYALLRYFRLGRYIYAVGGNRAAARVSGINVRKVEFLAYVLCSLCAAFAGLILTARVSSGQPTLGASLALVSVAAAVLGGISLYGGQGGVFGVAIGFIFITLLENGLNLLGVSSYAQLIAVGAAMILAIGWDQYLRRRRSDREVG